MKVEGVNLQFGEAGLRVDLSTWSPPLHSLHPTSPSNVSQVHWCRLMLRSGECLNGPKRAQVLPLTPL